MAIIRNPVSFSEHFNIDPTDLNRLGIFNPMLNVDTHLFIDPVLLDSSGQHEISKQASRSFRQYFTNLITLLDAIQRRGDAAWRQARKLFYFREVPYTCLGYGAAGIRGSAFGPDLTYRLVETAKEIIDLGIRDPDLFKLLPLLEEGIGADLISDMTTNVTLKNLIRLTGSICTELNVPMVEFRFIDERFLLPRNPTQRGMKPIIMVPKDILRTLPIASDWSEVEDVISENVEIRERVNRLIGDIWHIKTRREKKELVRRRALSSRQAFEALLSVIHEADIQPYDFGQDPKGLVAWHDIHESVAREFPLALALAGPPSSQKAITLVNEIIGQFKTLIENQGLWRMLWDDGRPRNENNCQMLFFGIEDAYCKANNLDVTPEAETGAGPVDFKFSSGYAVKIIVEVKLSNNSRLVHGYTTQLDTYRTATSPVCAFYLIIDVGGMGRKLEQLVEIKNAQPASGTAISEIMLVNGQRRPSASRR